jgi:hypothetical protein
MVLLPQSREDGFRISSVYWFSVNTMTMYECLDQDITEVYGTSAECNIIPHHLIYHLCVSKLYVWTNVLLRVDLAPNITEGREGRFVF